MANVQSGDEDRERRIRAIVAECLRDWAAGKAVDEIAIADAHPELEPELGQELRKLRVVGRAAAFAENPHTEDTFPLREMPPQGSGLRVRCPHCRHPMELLSEDEIQCHSCGGEIQLSDEHPEDQPTHARQLGHFRLEFLLGTGAFGAVWQAHDEELDRDVAIKIPRRNQLDHQNLEPFLREARIAAQLAHPHIVRVHEIGREGDVLYIVSDLVQGETLNQWMRERTLSANEIAKLCRTLALAIGHAHEAGVIHRDLKPANIMMDRQDEPKIMDFGLAKREVGEITMTADGQVLGTPAYMSPEQAAGDSHRVDGRSDIYSLGVILFELLTGELPFRGSVRMLMQQVIHEEPPRPRSLAGSVPRDLETICLKCLAKERHRRYRTAEELAEELERFVRGEPVLARPVSRVDRAYRWSKRHPMTAAVIALVTFLAIAGPASAYYQWSLRQANEQLTTANDRQAGDLNREKQVSPAEAALLARTESWFHAAPAESVAQELAPHYAQEDPAKISLSGLVGRALMTGAAGDASSVQWWERALHELEATKSDERTLGERVTLAECRMRLSGLVRQDAARSLDLAKASVEGLTPLVADRPQDWWLTYRLAEAEQNLARVLATSRETAAAAEVWARVADLRETLVAERPREDDGVYRLAHWLFAHRPAILVAPAASEPAP